MIQRFTLQEDEGGFIINSKQVPAFDKDGNPLYIDQEQKIYQRRNEVTGIEMYINTGEDVFKRVVIPRKHLVALYNKMKEIEKQELEYVKSQAA